MVSRFFLVTVSIFLSHQSFAQSNRTFAVFDVRKNLPLSNKETVQKDYYVNLGSDHGAKVGSVLSVKRRLPVIDMYRNQAQGDLVVEIAKLKVIHVQNSMSVGRVIYSANPKSIPVVPYESVMMGDQVEMTGDDAAQIEVKREQASVKKRANRKKQVKLIDVTVEKVTLPNTASAPAVAPTPQVASPQPQKAVAINTNPETATGQPAAPAAPAPAPAAAPPKP